MNRNSTSSVDVAPGGTQVVAHAGLHALGSFAHRIGLGRALSTAIPWSVERAPTHDRGTVLTHSMLMLAAGGEACSDIEFLASQPRLFGAAASDSTLYRTIRKVTPAVLADLATATATVRADMWRRIAATVGTATVVSDITMPEPARAPSRVSANLNGASDERHGVHSTRLDRYHHLPSHAQHTRAIRRYCRPDARCRSQRLPVT